MSSLSVPLQNAAEVLGAKSGKNAHSSNGSPRVARRKVAFPRAEDLSLDTVRAAQAGDLEAFRTIIESLQRLVYQTVYRLVGSRLNSEVEDITQEIFLKLHRNLRLFDASRGTKFHSWVLAMVRNYCFDVLKRKRLPMVSIAALSEDENESMLPSTRVEPRDTLASQEIQERIAAEVDDLPKQQRNAFILREYNGLSYQQIAEKSRCSEGTVKSRIHRAKESLRRRLGPLLSQLSRSV